MNDQLIFVAQRLVRESGYNLQKIVNQEPPLGENYSRASVIYKDACKLLELLDDDAQNFIKSTWGDK